MNDDGRLALAVRAAREAGEMLRQGGQIKVERKAWHDYVTDMDRESERMIREMLLSECPQDGFLGEEGGQIAGEREGQWIVDPIDGTTNFIRGLPAYSISIAYRRHSEFVIGVVYAPALDELFTAHLGGGAFLNGRPIRASRVETPEEAVAGMSFAHRNRVDALRMLDLLPGLTASLGDMRRMGSAAYDLCCVAAGRLDAFFELGLHLYDIAAGIAILTEAGGRVSGWPGEADAATTGNILATNGPLHAWFQSALRENGEKRPPRA